MALVRWDGVTPPKVVYGRANDFLPGNINMGVVEIPPNVIRSLMPAPTKDDPEWINIEIPDNKVLWDCKGKWHLLL